MPWTVTFYSTKVERETLDLPPGILASFLRIAQLIEEFGPDLGRPHTAPLGQGFCTVKGQEIVVLTTVTKKANRIPKRQIEMARKRMKEVQDGN